MRNIKLLDYDKWPTKPVQKNFYNKRVRVKNFKIGEWVLRKNKASHLEPLGKLSVTWEGPYKVVGTHRYGA